ncbi:MAG: hypothetical protein HY868_17735 [Chloroflexi bacterium]|nr:hypothetical protein [Chloroflexota bacterium]
MIHLSRWSSFITFAFFLGSVWLPGCTSAATPTPTPIPPSPTSMASPTATPVPTAVPPSAPTVTRTIAPTPSPTPTALPTLTPTLTASQRYPSAFGIDYGQPEKYRAQGDQTRLSDPSVINSLRGKAQSIAHLGEIYFWIKREFKTWSAGGSTIGAITTDQLMKERRLGGCHDWGLVYASVARDLGYPVVMIDTAGIAWAKRFLANQKGGYAGHVFVEVFVAGKWVLVDSTNNWYVETGYDPANPVIPINMGNETEGLFVMRKGVDTWGYGIRSNNELTRLMEESARQIKLELLQYPPYIVQRFK